jgi:hypothetical protein
MIRVSKHSIIIWTDHSVTAVIVKQIKLSIINIDKLNLRLIRVVMYLSQFDLNVRHKSKRDHIISDVLSRLSSFEDEKFTKNLENDILNDIDAYIEILVKMFNAFKKRLIQAYKTNSEWALLYKMLTEIFSMQATRQEIIESEKFTHEELEFERRNDLVYHLNRFISRTRLCISKSLIKKIFRMTHDDLMHVDFHRVCAAIFETLYIRRLAHHLRQYIAYCSECLLNQTKRHKSYESLYSITTSKISFHTITMNFVLALSEFEKTEKFDTLLIVIDKFSKDKLLILERNIWKAQNWAISLWKYLQLSNWDLSRVIIFDRNAKFRFDMWKFMFKLIDIDLLISTVYHSQIDDQNERINQTIEIALRYLLTTTNLFWHETLSSMQQAFMNTTTFTEHSPNEILYERNTRSELTLLNIDDDFMKNQRLLREIIRKDVVDAIDFVNARFKVIFDDKHKTIVFNTENMIYLRLHQDYSLLEKENLKLSNQRFDSYKVKRKINNVVYELNLSFNSRIHSIIFVIQLESASDSNSYNRSRSTNSDSVETMSDTSIKKSFEIEKVLKKRIRKYERTKITQYLMKWLEWELEHNSWVSAKDCSNFMKLIMNFENRQTARTFD